jgi:NADH-quinone oxidoreductase subunit N
VIITPTDLLSVLPALSVIAGAFAAVAAGTLLRPEKRQAGAELVSYLALGGGLATAVGRMFPGTGAAPEGFGGAVRLDELALFLSLGIIAATGLAVVMSADTAREQDLPHGEYYGLLLLAAGGMMLLVQSVDLITFFVALEILSLALYALSGILRKNARSNEASLKYFVTGAFASAFLLYGFTLLYGATGSLAIEGIAKGISAGPGPLVKTALALTAIGLAFKVGAVPFHQWVPDVYEGAPATVTAFMSTATKAAAFGGALRFFLAAGGAEPEGWGAVCWGLAMATMVGGNLLALVQKSVKRMLAYSSVAHSGYILTALAAQRSGAPEAAREAAAGAVFYLFVYVFMTLGAFAFLSYAGQGSRDAESAGDLEGLAKRRPWAAAAMAVFMFALAGIPPTSGFFGKFLLFKALVGAGEHALLLAGVLGSAVSVYYYLRVVVAMFMKPLPEGSPEPRPAFNVGLVVYATAAFTILLGLMPGKYLSLSFSSIHPFFR